MSTGIKVKSGHVAKESVEVVRDSILAILKSPNDQSTIQHALSVFEATCPKSEIKGFTVSNCSINFSKGGEQTEPNDD